MYETREGVRQNYETAIKWYTIAAEQGTSKDRTR
jgi:TPR repeat protein